MLQTDSISITPELSASAQKSRAGKLNCCKQSGSQIQGGRLSMTYFCEQEALNMKQNTQGFWLCVFTSYGNAFSSQHQSKAGIWCTTIKRLQCENKSLQYRRENLAIFPLLCRSSYGCLTQFEHGTCTSFACSFLSPCTQTIFPFFSLVSENLPLAFHPKSNNSNQTSYCLIPVISSGFWPSPHWHHLLPFHRGCRLWSLSQPSALQFWSALLGNFMAFFHAFPTILSFLSYLSACTLFSAISSALHPVLDSITPQACPSDMFKNKSKTWIFG